MSCVDDDIAHKIGMCSVTRKALETSPDVDLETGHQMYLEWAGYVRDLIDFIQDPAFKDALDREFPPRKQQDARSEDGR